MPVSGPNYQYPEGVLHSTGNRGTAVLGVDTDGVYEPILTGGTMTPLGEFAIDDVGVTEVAPANPNRTALIFQQVSGPANVHLGPDSTSFAHDTPGLRIWSKTTNTLVLVRPYCPTGKVMAHCEAGTGTVLMVTEFS